MIGHVVYYIFWIIMSVYHMFVKSFRYIYYLLGYQTTEHEMAKTILQISIGCPDKYAFWIMLLYSITYVGCFECGLKCQNVFDSFHLLMASKKRYNRAVNFNEIRQVLKQHVSNSNEFILTNEMLLSLQKGSANMTKEYHRNLITYVKCLLMALSMYCPHQWPMFKDKEKPKELTMQDCGSSLLDLAMSREIKKFNTIKSKKNINSLPRKSYNIDKQEQSIKSHQVVDRLFYPASLQYALQMLPECHLVDRTSLTIHVVSSSTALLETKHWEVFMYGFPKLNRLNVVFIIQDKSFKKSLNPCNWEGDWGGKKHMITYSVQYMHYHMYFSLDEYIEPDVVVIYHNRYEMSTSEESDIHSEISYSNMTHNSETILVLMDSTEELVKQGVRNVNAVRPVNQILLPQVNHIRRSGSNSSELDTKTEKSLIEDNFFTCLCRK